MTRTTTRRGVITEWLRGSGNTVRVELETGELVTAVVPRPPAKKCECTIAMVGNVPRIVGYSVHGLHVAVTYAEEPDE